MQALVVVPTLGDRDLATLVDAIAQECRSAAATPLVLHNGPASADVERVCAAAGVTYANHEPRGYSKIRNAAIERARKLGCDVLVMIDDDEVPEPGWLAGLLAPFEDGAEVVVGPVKTRWPDNAPARFVRSDLPRPLPRQADGPIAGDLRSGNCAVRLDAVGDARFDERFDRTGGEDTAFFRRLRAEGARCYWANSAAVVELVDADRVSLRYFAKRAFSQGRALAAIRSAMPRSDDPPARQVLRARLARAARLTSWTITRRSVSRALEAACELAFVAGFVRGAP